MISRISRQLAVAAALAALIAGAVPAAGAARPAFAAEAGRAKSAACTFVPVDDSEDSTAPAAVDWYRTPFAVPAHATAFTSPDGFGGREYLLAPSAGSCVARAGLDLDFNQQITLPGQRSPSFEQVFGAGGDNQLRYGCRYLPTIRRFADALSPQDCSTPPVTEHIGPIDTGTARLPAALVTVAPKVKDPQLTTTGTDPVLAVVLAFDRGSDPHDPTYRIVTTSYADCRLGAATRRICLASLQAFADEAIAFQRRAGAVALTGEPGARIRAAVAEFGRTYRRDRP